jgi:hypothetical protein
MCNPRHRSRIELEERHSGQRVLDSLHSFPGDQSSMRKLSALWGVLRKGLIIVHHRKVRKLFKLNIISYLTPIQIHSYSYYLVGICFEKTGYKHKWDKICFTQQHRTDNSGFVLFYIKLQ